MLYCFIIMHNQQDTNCFLKSKHLTTFKKCKRYFYYPLSFAYKNQAVGSVRTHHTRNVEVKCVVIYYNIGSVTGTGTFVEDTPHSFLLWQQPVVESGHLFEVCTGANEQQSKYQDAIKRIHYK